jgi:hypothetical protein
MPLHDLRCTACEAVRENVWVRGTDYPPCPSCGGRMDWLPFVPMTDCYGSTKTSEILYEDIGTPATYSSRRELERKMKRMNFEPCGDKVGGARNDDGYRGSSFSFAGKMTRSSPRAARPSRET